MKTFNTPLDLLEVWWDFQGMINLGITVLLSIYGNVMSNNIAKERIEKTRSSVPKFTTYVIFL